jgi:hypothetical protein
MEFLMQLLLGREPDALTELLRRDTRAEAALARQVRRAGEWCATTPGAELFPFPG